jgi:hypothetical protein
MDTMRLLRTATDDGWFGQTGTTGYNLTLSIPDAIWPAPHLLTLGLNKDILFIEEYTFQYLRITDTPRWDTGDLIQIWTPGHHFAFLHVMA